MHGGLRLHVMLPRRREILPPLLSHKIHRHGCRNLLGLRVSGLARLEYQEPPIFLS
jgi:hypothetical protein